MIKSELVTRVLAQNPHLFQSDIEKIVNAILEEIVAAIAQGGRVEVRGFGIFTVRHRSARSGRNPRTGAPVVVNQKNLPYFKAGKEMHRRLNKPELAQG
jgi:integration host factor subunit beta